MLNINVFNVFYSLEQIRGENYSWVGADNTAA